MPSFQLTARRRFDYRAAYALAHRSLDVLPTRPNSKCDGEGNGDDAERSNAKGELCLRGGSLRFRSFSFGTCLERISIEQNPRPERGRQGASENYRCFKRLVPLSLQADRQDAG